MPETMNTNNLVPFWQSQLLDLTNRLPVTGGPISQAELEKCTSAFKVLVSDGCQIIENTPTFKDKPKVVNIMIAQDNHLGLLHNYVRRHNLNNKFPRPLRDTLQNLIVDGIAACSGHRLNPWTAQRDVIRDSGSSIPAKRPASTWSPAIGHSSRFSHTASEGTDPSDSAVVKEAIRVLQHSDGNVFRTDDTDTFFQLATLKATLARQDAELRAHLLVRQATAVRVNELRERMERHEHCRLRNFRRPPSPGVATSTRTHDASVPMTRDHTAPTSSSKKSVKEWKEGKEKEKTSKVQAPPTKPSEAAAETSTSKSPTKVKEAAPKTKTKPTKEAATPEVKEKPKTRAASQAEGLKSKGKRCAALKSKETISEEEGEEGETIEKDEDVEMQEVDAKGEEVDEDIPIDQQDEEDEDSD
ncbi:hypothetical protein EST38_g11832 [Candolleomyces aberdarensis]|uniref:Uncharacterized protein n=1 Tax=Candolleomyces aberdarensis TaxID=2316362 RepID=A0A4Q2D673_9AGAR|nr:hypothetical protein EST38_g11832 [Candolleomyces aberdarensis]